MAAEERATELMKQIFGHRWDDDPYEHNDDWLEAKTQIESAILDEREACAKIAEGCSTIVGLPVNVAEKIRARSQS